jgi:hypothetical protein
MFDDERSLVQKYQGRPFALLGVDGDPDRSTLQKAEKKYHLSWRSWWDEGGAIASQWKVIGLPTLFLLDHKGVVRWQGLGVPKHHELEKRIEQLVKEAESEGGKVASLSRR